MITLEAKGRHCLMVEPVARDRAECSCGQWSAQLFNREGVMDMERAVMRWRLCHVRLYDSMDNDNALPY